MRTLPKPPPLVLLLLILLLAAAGTYGVFRLAGLNTEIRDRFEGRRWALPARVYARPLELYAGMNLSAAMLEEELQLSDYRLEDALSAPGGYRRDGDSVELLSRPFVFPSGPQPAQALSVRFSGGRVAAITSSTSGEDLPTVRLDPAQIGSFHPLIHEDRILVTAEQVPVLLQKALMAVEDRDFLHHHGISPTGIARALIANIRAGRTVQGGSTLTQQLVKNLFLSRERTLSRKLREMVMALLLDAQYDKEEILTAYVNEVFLGQDGRRAIHGFALAARYYFRRGLGDLSTAQLATLVGMVKGPSAYNPLSAPEKCLARRNTVLEIMLSEGLIDEPTFTKASKAPLLDGAPQKSGFNRYPAFLDLVKRQLSRDYREEDLKTAGLQILTTLDPHVQAAAENSLRATLEKLAPEAAAAVDGAVIVTDRQNGEVQAVVGGGDVRGNGFNRALDARRPIGSLVKPAVYLAALAGGSTLATPIEDRAISLEGEGGNWQPKNYDNVEHGRVPLYQALARSYNLATVRLGLQTGLDTVAATLSGLGFTPEGPLYPSLLLGALEMSPLEVAQLYQTIASGGFYLPLRAIQSVSDGEGRVLTRYGLQVEQRFSAELIFLLDHCLQRVMSEGTGKNAGLPAAFEAAGKTGTTDGLRDSWFAGYAGDRLAVAWLGNDHNRPVGLTGSSGALRVWAKMMTTLPVRPLNLPKPAGIVWHRIDLASLQRTYIFNRNSTVLPFIAANPAVGAGQRKTNPLLEAVERTAGKIGEAVDELLR